MAKKTCKRHRWRASRETAAEDFCMRCLKRRRVSARERRKREARGLEVDRAACTALSRMFRIG